MIGSVGAYYQLSQERPFSQEIYPLLISCSAIYIAASCRSNQGCASKPEDACVIDCRHINARVVLPLHGFIEHALGGLPLVGMGVGVLPGRRRALSDPTLTSGFRDVFDRMIQPFLVNHFVRGRETIEKRHTEKRPSWPSSWQMGWLVRNALSHDGKVYFESGKRGDQGRTTPKPVHWRGLEIRPEDQGTPILGNLVSFGDLIILALEMEEAERGPIPWIPMSEPMIRSGA
jgi:hypothetical protein